MSAAARFLRSPVLLAWVCVLFGTNVASSASLPLTVRAWLSATPLHGEAVAGRAVAPPAHGSVREEPADAPDDDLKGQVPPALAPTTQALTPTLVIAHVSTGPVVGADSFRALTPLGPRPPPTTR